MFHTLPEMKSRTFMKTVSCVGILLYLSGFTQCQRRMVAPGTIQGTRTAGTVGGVRSPGMRLRSMGTVPSSQISNQTSSRRGSPRLLGFIIPSAGGGRPQLRLMPGAQDFIRPGRRIAAAPISQLSRLGGSRTNPTSRVLRGRGTSAARSLTNVPTSVLNQARSGFRGTATQGGQIRRLPQSALNTISDAARGRAQTQNRQPNIVFVRPPARTSARTSGLSPDMVRRIRLAAMQRANNGQRGTVAGQRVLPSGQMISTNGQRIAANGQRIATAGQRMIPTGQRIATAGQRVPTVGQRIATGFNRNAMLQSTGFNGNAAQPQTLNRAPVQTGIRRVGTQTRMLPDLATRRRIAAMNAARNRAASVPRQTMPVQRGTVQTDVLRPRVRGPARVDEAVLQANIVPAGLSPSLSGIRRSGSTLTSGSISRELPAAPTVSSDSRMITSGSTSGSVGGGVMSTGRSGVQPTETVIAPAPDIQFRTTVGETPVSSVSAGVSGIGGAAPILDAGPAFQVVSGDASNVIIGPGASVADTLPVDVSGASGPTMGVNPTVVSSGTSSVTAMDNTPGFTGGATLSMADPTVRAAVDPTLASLGSVIGATGIQTVGALPTLESIGSSGSSAMVPGAGNVATTIAESNPDMNSIKSVITDVLRDMAAQGQSSNVQPDIGMMARAVLEAQQSAHDKPNPIGSHQTVPDTKPRKPIVQTFTLTPESPSIILNADPTSVVSSPTEISNNLIAPSKASIQHSHSDFFGGAGHGTDIHHTAKPVVTSHAPVNTAPTFPVVTDPHMIDAFHTHGPHDLLHGHVHPEPQLVLHDSLHHHIPHTHEILPTDVGVTKPKLQTKSTTVKQRITTTPAPPTTKAANEQRNLIVGDWSGAEQSLSGNQPPPPPSRDLALEHPHGHHHFESHVHGFTKPSIPPPPPTAEMVLTTNPVDVQPTDQLMDKQPTLQIVDVQPVGQQVDIQPSNQLIDLHHPNQPIDTHLVGVLDNITPKNASPATGNTVAKSASTGTKETSGVHNVLIDPNIGHLSHDPLHSITDHGHSIHDLGHLVTDPGTSAHQAGPASHGHGHNLSADFSANNVQSGGVSIPVSAVKAGIDNINTIAIENKLFDANMPSVSERIPRGGASVLVPGAAVASEPALDTTRPIGEQLMKQLPVPTELVSALTGGTAETNIPPAQLGLTDITPKISDSMILQGNFPDTLPPLQDSAITGAGDQGFSLNNVRDGVILDAMPSGLQTNSVGNTNLGMLDRMPLGTNSLSASSLDRLAMDIPSGMLSLDSSVPNNNDPTIRKIANILPKPRGFNDLPIMSLDAEGFTAEGRFNTFQRGFNRTRKLSSKDGINIQVNLTPFSSTEAKSSSSNKSRKDTTNTANIQTDGSFLGSALPNPPMGAGKEVILSDLSNQQPFYDQSSLLGAFVDVLPKPAEPRIVPVNVPLPPPQTDMLMIPANGAPATDVQVDAGQTDTVMFTSTFDAPSTQFVDPNMPPPAAPAGGFTTDFVGLDPNWAVFDPTAIPADMNFTDINPIVNGVVGLGPEIQFVNTNDITFTNAFDVAPVVYDPVLDPAQPASSVASINSVSETVPSNTPPGATNTNIGVSGRDSVGNTKTDTSVNNVKDNVPNDKGLQFQEVVIAPLPERLNNNALPSVDLQAPPPIF